MCMFIDSIRCQSKSIEFKRDVATKHFDLNLNRHVGYEHRAFIRLFFYIYIWWFAISDQQQQPIRATLKVAIWNWMGLNRNTMLIVRCHTGESGTVKCHIYCVCTSIDHIEMSLKINTHGSLQLFVFCELMWSHTLLAYTANNHALREKKSRKRKLIIWEPWQMKPDYYSDRMCLLASK